MILLIAPEEDSGRLLRETLLSAGREVRWLTSIADAESYLAYADLLILDAPSAVDLATLRERANSHGPPVLLLVETEPAGLCHEVYIHRSASPAKLLGHVRALARLRIAERAARDSHALYHSLVETLPVCIFRKDREGRFTFVNGPFCAELKRRPEEVLHRRDADFYPDDLARKYAADDRRVIDSGQIFEGVEENITPEGQRRYVSVIKAPLLNGAGQIIGMQGAFWDVTARRFAEEELARTTTDLAGARRIQQKLLPAADSPLVRRFAQQGLEIGGGSFPVDAVGGDCFDWFSRNGELGVVVADVSGHGIGPALLMTMGRSYLRATAQGPGGPAELLRQVNRLLGQDIEGDRYITAMLAMFNPSQSTFTYASAGHATALVLDQNGAVKLWMTSTGLPLGIDPNATFEESGPHPLSPGDIVVLLTDGIVEARDPEMHTFTLDRAATLIHFYRNASARQIVANLFYAVRAFAQILPQLDDMTAVVVKVRSPD